MSFQAPLFLLALALAPLALGAQLVAQRRRRRYALRFPAVATLRALAPRERGRRRYLPPALVALAIAGLIVALARPEQTVAVPVEQASAMLVTDVSRSMQATDVEPSRLAAAKRAARRFLDRAPRELRVGAVSFSDAAATLQPPTTEHQRVRAAIDDLSTIAGTATGEGIDEGRRALEADRRGERRERPPAAIVLLSDGQATVGRDPLAAARDAARAGVPIFTVALGSLDGVIPDPSGFGPGQPVPPDPETMRRIAALSGGQAFAAQDTDQLDSIYERLGSRLATEPEQREITAAFAGAGVVLLLAALGTSLRFSGRLP